MKNILIVGAGFFGAVLAERLAEDAGVSVTIIDRRNHIGGNCWSEIDATTGVEFHKYGSHIFHTSDDAVWSYINKFTSFNDYRHVVWTTYKSRAYSMPMNLGTINSYYDMNLTPFEVEAFIQQEAAKENIKDPKNLEEKAINLIGRPLYEAFIRGYTIKQWEKGPTELAAEIITRLPVRYNYNNRYFADKHEGIPTDGYGKVFEKMLKHPKIEVRLGVDCKDMQTEMAQATLVCYTGAIDEFFEYQLGRLEWRTVDFETERYDYTDFQGTSVMNYADEDVPYTRVHEFKHYHPERADTGKTLVFREYSRFAKDYEEPYYPIATANNQNLFVEYQKLAAQNSPQVIFGGRLGKYKYYDMDDAIAAALTCYKEEVLPHLRKIL